MSHTIDSARRDSITLKRVRENNVEHSRYHLIMSANVLNRNVNCNNLWIKLDRTRAYWTMF